MGLQEESENQWLKRDKEVPSHLHLFDCEIRERQYGLDTCSHDLSSKRISLSEVSYIQSGLLQ